MNKDKVITIRLSKETYENIKKTQDSVSKFIRDSVDKSLQAARNLKKAVVVEVTDSTKSESQYNYNNIFAYQKADLARDSKCETCNSELKMGETVILGFSDASAKPNVFCLNCGKNNTVEENVSTTLS